MGRDKWYWTYNSIQKLDNTVFSHHFTFLKSTNIPYKIVRFGSVHRRYFQWRTKHIVVFDDFDYQWVITNDTIFPLLKSLIPRVRSGPSFTNFFKFLDMTSPYLLTFDVKLVLTVVNFLPTYYDYTRHAKMIRSMQIYQNSLYSNTNILLWYTS